MASRGYSNNLIFFVNGIRQEIINPSPETFLIEYLRTILSLTGTKLSCNAGGCGACTVTLSRLNFKGVLVHYAINACITKLASLHGNWITTIEGLGSVKKGLHPLQEALYKGHGSQCGFCSPGMVMSASSLFRQKAQSCQLVDLEDVETCLVGNLCRCTGYRPILESFGHCADDRGKDYGHGGSSQIPSNVASDMKEYQKQALEFRGQTCVWLKPTSLEQLQALRTKHHNIKYVGGGSGNYKVKEDDSAVLVNLSEIAELRYFHEDEHFFEFGAGLRLSEMQDIFNDLAEADDFPVVKVFQEVLARLASTQIRNVATVGGALMWPHSCSDLMLLCSALKCTLVTIPPTDGCQLADMTMDAAFFPHGMNNIATKRSIIKSVKVPKLGKGYRVAAFKKGRRKTFDLAILSAVAAMKYDGCEVKDFHALIGGSSGKTGESMETLVSPTEFQALVKPGAKLPIEWNAEMTESLKASVPDNYKRVMAVHFFKSFLRDDIQEPVSKTANALQRKFQVHHTSLNQEIDKCVDTVELPIPHIWGDEQVAGTAEYVDDIPHFKDELYLVLVTSTRSKGKISSIRFEEALKVTGVVGHISANDYPRAKNLAGGNPDGQPIFATHEVSHFGQAIAGLVCNNLLAGKKAVPLVQVFYESEEESMEKVVLGFHEAHKDLRSLEAFGGPQKMSRLQNPKDVEDTKGRTISGTVCIGGQEHFYMEPSNCLVVPCREKDEYSLFVSAQSTELFQAMLSEFLDVKRHKITVTVRRAGGGFGGKECGNTLTLMTTAAAKKFNRPVRLTLTSGEDMQLTGKRHEIRVDYRVSVDQQGKITNFDAECFVSAGIVGDVSPVFVQVCILRLDSGYTLTNFSALGHAVKTNIPSNVAMRGFGGPEGSVVTEAVMDQLCHHFRFDPLKIREMNMTKEDDILHYSDNRVKGCTLTECWKSCIKESDYYKQLKQVQQFNETSQYIKQGITMVPMKMGITGMGVGEKQMNQGLCTIQIYKDGSILLQTGGIEMGQGLHTKLIQVAGKSLGVSIAKIHTQGSCSNGTPNAIATGASVGTDLYGPAVVQACNKINHRLEKYKSLNPSGTWEDWVMAAYSDCTSLVAYGHYDNWHGLDFNFGTNKGKNFHYFTYGAGALRVEVNCVTGDITVLSAHLVLDLGNSINPAIDIGQVEGAFVQGLGYMTTEQLVRSKETGQLLSCGPGDYKVPNVTDLPLNLNVTFLKHKDTIPTSACLSSKAIGEPPLILSTGIPSAVRMAVKAFRKDNHLGGNWFDLHPPLTPEKVSLVCQELLSSAKGIVET